MDANFWHEKWKNGETAFHQHAVNPMLKQHIGKLSLTPGSRVFVPLCGKTKDIGWLLSEGYQVAGAELSELVVKELFKGLGVTAEIATVGESLRYRTENLEIFVGDIFSLSADTLGPVDAIYDRAALVALPVEVRVQYSSHLIEITHGSSQLLVTYEYNQQLMNGPPFSINRQEIVQHYQNTYHLNLVAQSPISGGLKGKTEAIETTWVLSEITRRDTEYCTQSG